MSVTDEIKERLDIVEVISTYVPLKKAGRSYKGLCPFHNEKTPSFVVFPDNQSWHCFGACGIGGDIFSFVMKRENLDFAEALRLLAAKAGIELQPREGQPPAAEQHLERLREIVANAAGYFHYLLINAGEAARARDYLERRGLLRATWESWQLGYALDAWDALKDHLARKGYTPEEVEEAGLTIRREDGSGYYDRFRGRLMIPIRDGQGRTIGFGGRILREDAAHPQPKYINSPQTPLFDKSSAVFGLDMARKAIRDADLAVIVEGYMDVLMSHQVDVRNVVGGMGTALTESQLRQIKRLTSNVTLALDPDVAGDHATLRGLETARQVLGRGWEPVIGPNGLVRQESRLKAQLRIAALPDGLDPDELALRDPASWRQVIASARPIVDYYLAVVGREENLAEARGKANAVARMAPLIREINNPVERAHYIQLLARMVQTDERVVAAEVSAAGREARRSTRDEETGTGEPAQATQDAQQRAGDGRPVANVHNPSLVLEEHILGYLLMRPDLLAALDAEMSGQNAQPLAAEDFSGVENRAILAALLATLPLHDEWTFDGVLERLHDVLHERCLTLLEKTRHNPPLTDEKLTKDMVDSLLHLRDRNIHQQINQLRFLILESQGAGTGDQPGSNNDMMDLYRAQDAHTQKLLLIQKLLNARTMTGAQNQALNRTQG